MFKKLIATALLTLTGVMSAAAWANYPDKPVKIIVANPPGGPVDVMLRVLATRLSEVWGQPVVVENRPGGSTVIAAQALMWAAETGGDGVVDEGVLQERRGHRGTAVEVHAQ